MAEPRVNVPSALLLIGLYERAAQDLARIVARAAAQGQLATAAQRNRQLQAILRVLGQLLADTRGLPAQVVQEGWEAGDRVAIRAIGAQAGGAVNQRAMRVLAANLDSSLRQHVRLVGRRANDRLRTIGLEETAKAVAEGLTVREQSQRIADRLRREGFKGYRDRAGRNWKLETYATMRARTDTRQATSQATLERVKDVGFDLIEISRHRGSCPVCLPFEGDTFSISGRTPGFKRLVPERDLPPYHPNCEHVAFPSPLNAELLDRGLLLSGAAVG